MARPSLVAKRLVRESGAKDYARSRRQSLGVAAQGVEAVVVVAQSGAVEPLVGDLARDPEDPILVGHVKLLGGGEGPLVVAGEKEERTYKLWACRTGTGCCIFHVEKHNMGVHHDTDRRFPPLPDAGDLH